MNFFTSSIGVFWAVEGIIVCFLTLPFLSVLVSLCAPKRKKPAPAKELDYACIITAYQNAAIAIPLVDSLLKQQYRRFTIYLVADDCPEAEFPTYHGKLIVLQPKEKLGSKVKSIQHAIDHFVGAHEGVVIFDPDNLAHPAFLSEINAFFGRGFRAVQGQRVAKNLDTVYACLDAMGEYYYNYVVRKVPFAIGSSATIAGSGMAIDTQLYLEYLYHPAIAGQLDRVIVAEDKILQSLLVEKGNRIAYAEHALVYDEKVVSGAQVERQRTRWINSYFKHAGEGLGLMLKGASGFSFNRAFFGYLLIYPPMFLLILASVTLLPLAWWINPLCSYALLGGLILFTLTFLLVLWLNHAPGPVWKALGGIPAFISKQVLALFRIQRSNKDFMATTHTRHLTIEEVMQQRK